MKRLQLFCLPYAGGSSSLFYEFAANLPDWIDMIPIEYSESGQKDLHPTFHHMIQEVAAQVQNSWDDKPFAILGYSMGSLVAYELYYELVRKYNRKPIHMFFAAHIPPSRHKALCLSRTDVVERVKNNLSHIGIDLPDDEQQSLLEWVIPKYSKDLDLYNQYSYVPGRQGIDANITVLYSDVEKQQNNIFEWSDICLKFCHFQRMGASHFFIHQESKSLAVEVVQTLSSELRHPILSK